MIHRKCVIGNIFIIINFNMDILEKFARITYDIVYDIFAR
jgi:hypothetical protein